MGSLTEAMATIGLRHWNERPRSGKSRSMASDSYDVLILGGGNAGFGVTVPTREAGLKVALVEERDLGGTCPNRGCTPKKVLVAAGHALHEINQAHVHGISVSKPKLDWAALIDREKEMISGIPDSLRRNASGARRRSLPRQRQLRWPKRCESW